MHAIAWNSADDVVPLHGSLMNQDPSNGVLLDHFSLGHKKTSIENIVLGYLVQELSFSSIVSRITICGNNSEAEVYGR